MWNFKYHFFMSFIILCFVLSRQQVRAQDTDSLPHQLEVDHPLTIWPYARLSPRGHTPIHPDSVAKIKINTDGIKFPAPWISSLDVNFDYLNLYTYALDNRQRLEAGAGIMIKDRFYLNGSYGESYYASDRAYRNGDMISEGSFMRFGIDYKVNITPKAYLMLGAKYGMADFSSELHFEVFNPLFEDLSSSVKANNLSAQWYEIILTSEQEFFANVWLGWNVRAKRIISYTDFKEEDIINVYQIPGFGRTLGNWTGEINLLIKYRIPLKLFQ